MRSVAGDGSIGRGENPTSRDGNRTLTCIYLQTAIFLESTQTIDKISSVTARIGAQI